MRVAVQHVDPDHPNGQVFAYRYGQVQATTHPITGETFKPVDIMVALLALARQEYPEPDYRVWPQKLAPVDPDGKIGEDPAEWVDLDEATIHAQAAGEAVEIAALEQPAKRSRKVAAEQETATTEQEG